MGRESLWNLTEKKLFEVRKYIEKLEVFEHWGEGVKIHFERVKAKALASMNANEALNLIGYCHKTQPGLYDNCWAIDNNQRKKKQQSSKKKTK